MANLAKHLRIRAETIFRGWAGQRSGGKPCLGFQQAGQGFGWRVSFRPKPFLDKAFGRGEGDTFQKKWSGVDFEVFVHKFVALF
jgi:hypothetical protein